MRALPILAALALGCGSLQPALAPEQVLMDGEKPRYPTDKDLRWCRPFPGVLRENVLVTGDTCWLELDATQKECAHFRSKEEGWRYLLYGGRCWYFHARKAEREPTSSVHSPAPEVLTNVPVKPYKVQKRPGKDGKCSTHRLFFELNGGCWVRVDIPLEECHFDETAETFTPLFIYKGACIMPMLDTDRREPTSSAEHQLPEHKTLLALTQASCSSW